MFLLRGEEEEEGEEEEGGEKGGGEMWLVGGVGVQPQIKNN